MTIKSRFRTTQFTRLYFFLYCKKIVISSNLKNQKFYKRMTSKVNCFRPENADCSESKKKVTKNEENQKSVKCEKLTTCHYHPTC